MSDSDTKQPIILDTPTIEAMLEPQGTVSMSPEFITKRLIGISVDTNEVEEARSKGHDALLEFKDEILRDMDTRLTQILSL
jgi:hypothetical protein